MCLHYLLKLFKIFYFNVIFLMCPDRFLCITVTKQLICPKIRLKFLNPTFLSCIKKTLTIYIIFQ